MRVEGQVAALPARPEAAPSAGWQARAVRAYELSLPSRRAELRAELAARLLGFAGKPLAPRGIYVNPEGSLAVAGVGGTTFRLYKPGGLVVVRPCAYCGLGRFESPQITDLADLGYAVSGWRPLHEGCEDFDTEDLGDW